MCTATTMFFSPQEFNSGILDNSVVAQEKMVTNTFKIYNGLFLNAFPKLAR